MSERDRVSMTVRVPDDVTTITALLPEGALLPNSHPPSQMLVVDDVQLAGTLLLLLLLLVAVFESTEKG